jgi:BASS family bile acid:Na+ symporter
MNNVLSQVSNLAVQLFAVTSMASVGLSYTLGEILGPLRNVRGVVLALVANFLAVPVLAFLIVRVLSLPRPYGIGLLLVVSIGYMPLVVPRLVSDVTVSTWAIAAPLVFTMLLPLVVGLTVDAVWPRAASRVLPVLSIVSNSALVVLIVLTVVLNLRTVLGVGAEALGASVLLLAGSFVIGWVCGGFGEHLQDEMAFGTAQRNFAAAVVVATESFRDREVLVMIVVVSLVSMPLLFGAAKVMSRVAARGSATPA